MALPKLSKTKWPNVKRDPKGRYWVDVKIAGKRHRQCCDSAELAKAYLAKLVEQDRRLQLFPEEAAAKRYGEFTMEALAAHFEEEISNRVSAKTMASYHTSDSHLTKHFSSMPVRALELVHVLRYRTARTNQGAAPASINRELERLRNLLNMAERERILLRSPLRDEQITLTADNRVRYVEKDEWEAMRWACADDPWLWSVIVFACRTGLRAREMWALTWDQVTPKFLKVTRPKTSTKDHLPIRQTVRDILQQRSQAREIAKQKRGRVSNLVWESPMGLEIDHDNFTARRLRPMLRRAGVRNLKHHDFRHDFCSRLAMAGVPLQAIMALAGHSSIKTTMKYSHLSPDYLTGALDALEETALVYGDTQIGHLEEAIWAPGVTLASPITLEPASMLR